jgi:hypothetical protein
MPNLNALVQGYTNTPGLSLPVFRQARVNTDVQHLLSLKRIIPFIDALALRACAFQK